MRLPGASCITSATRRTLPRKIQICPAYGNQVLKQALTPYSPLARGLLAGTRERSGERHTLRSGTDDLFRSLGADFDVVDTVRAIAIERSLQPAQIALAWLLGKPGVSAPIIGATKPRHLDETVPALEVTLTADEIARLEAPYSPHSDGDYT